MRTCGYPLFMATNVLAEGHVEETALTDVVRKVLREGPFAMRQLAADSGLSYDVLRSWRSGRRRPNPESVRKLADGIARRSDALRELSRDLRRFV
jgi:hypothetical protein